MRAWTGTRTYKLIWEGRGGERRQGFEERCFAEIRHAGTVYIIKVPLIDCEVQFVPTCCTIQEGVAIPGTQVRYGGQVFVAPGLLGRHHLAYYPGKTPTR
jgi:hypothetical protein